MFIASIIFSIVLYYVQDKEQNQRLITSGNLITSLLASNVRIGVFSEDIEYIKEAVEIIHSRPYVVSVIVLTQEGKILFDSRGEHGKTALSSEQNVNNYKSGFKENAYSFFFTEPVQVTSNNSSDSHDDMFFEIEQNKKKHIIGYVNVEITKKSLTKGRRLLAIKVLAGLLIFLLLTIPLSYLIANEATGPIRALLERIKAKSPPDVVFTDLDLLNKTYIDMLNNLEQSFNTINDLRMNLEDKVKTRTSELNNAKCKLEKTLTELMMAQAKLIQSEKMAALGHIAAGVAHEVNNAANVISGSLHSISKTLKRLQENPGSNLSIELFLSSNRYITNINIGIKRISNIVRDLTSFARPGSNQDTVIDINKELDTTLRFIEPECKKRIEIKKDYGTLKPIVSHSDTLSQVFLNIFINAIQSIEGKGILTVVTRMIKKNVIISIHDTGAGIPSDDIPKIFDPFYTTKPVGKGTGLGLSISYSIVKDHGGEIQVDSIVGKGTTVNIILPLLQEAAEA